ncbi:MAG: tetratricopeptide repeat protein [Bdellovibrionales bacterium]|nr:tetratricopeptide repeat protein [Bdellovibrionales bacterium]
MNPGTEPLAGSALSSDRQIQELLNRRDFANAEHLIRQRMTAQPADADAHYFLGVSSYFQGQIGRAIESLRKALNFDPQHTDAAVCLSVLLNDIGKYDDAKGVFDQANQSISAKRAVGTPEIERKFAVKHLELADLYLRYRRYDEAIEEYGKAASLDPADPEIRIRRAKALAKKGFVTRAIQELQQLRAESSSYPPARIQLGLLHYSQGNVLDAELEWEAVLEAEPTHREALAYLEMIRAQRISGRA